MTGARAPVLHGYWRSGTSYRTRIALNLKGIAFDQVTHDLRTGEQPAPEYLALNPQGLVPALDLGGTVLTQSTAVLEWLEERHPSPPLLPGSPEDRARVRAMALLIACDVHPLNNVRVLSYLRAEFGADEASVSGWTSRWITDGFIALEELVARHGDGFCYGAKPTLADCHLVPQVYSAERFGVDLSPYPAIRAANARMLELPQVAAAHPDQQPDSGASS